MDLFERLQTDADWMAGINKAADGVMAYLLSRDSDPGGSLEHTMEPPPDDAYHIRDVLTVPADVDADDAMLRAIATEMLRQEVDRRLELRRG